MAKKQPANKPPAEDVKRPRIRLVYIGPYRDSENKVFAQLVAITDEQFADRCLPEQLPETRLYGGKVPKQLGRPGSIYSFEHEAEGERLTIWVGSRQWAGFLDNDERVAKWQAEHDALYTAIEAEKMEKKGKHRNLLHENLAPVKRAYQKAVGRQKQALLALVIGYITSRGED